MRSALFEQFTDRYFRRTVLTAKVDAKTAAEHAKHDCRSLRQPAARRFDFYQPAESRSAELKVTVNDDGTLTRAIADRLRPAPRSSGVRSSLSSGRTSMARELMAAESRTAASRASASIR